MVNVVGNLLFAAFFFWASKIYANWHGNVTEPFLCEFTGNIFRRLRLQYFYHNRNVVVSLMYLVTSIDAFLDAVNAATNLH